MKKRVFVSISGLVLFGLFAFSCNTPTKKSQLRVSEVEGGGYELDKIAFCADRKCQKDTPGFEIKLKRKNVLLIYLDLRNTGNMDIISWLKEGKLSKLNVVVKSNSGATLARVPINYQAIRYKVVQEIEFDAVPFSGAPLPEPGSQESSKEFQATGDGYENSRVLELTKQILPPYQSVTETVEYGDKDIIPQAIELNLDENTWEIGAFIYLELQLKTSTISEENREIETGKKDVEIEAVSQTWGGLSTPPFSFTIVR